MMLSIMTLSIMTLSITMLNIMTLSITTLIIMALDAEYCYADCYLCSMAFVLSVTSKLYMHDVVAPYKVMIIDKILV
jgi:hypothetical protein